MAARICMQLFCMKSFSSSPRNSAKLMTFNMPDVWHIESSIWRCSIDSGLQDPRSARADLAMIIPSSSIAIDSTGTTIDTAVVFFMRAYQKYGSKVPRGTSIVLNTGCTSTTDTS